MKKIIFSLLAIVMVVGFSNKVMAQAVSEHATATATIQTPISIAATVNNLDFGKIVTGTDGGTVTIAATSAGERTKTGANVILAMGSTPNSAAFTVSGDAASGTTYTISMTPDKDTDLTLNKESSTETMAVRLVCAPTAVDGGVLTSGSQVIYVGGTLTVAADQAAGVYNSQADAITIEVNYN